MGEFYAGEDTAPRRLSYKLAAENLIDHLEEVLAYSTEIILAGDDASGVSFYSVRGASIELTKHYLAAIAILKNSKVVFDEDAGEQAIVLDAATRADLFKFLKEQVYDLIPERFKKLKKGEAKISNPLPSLDTINSQGLFLFKDEQRASHSVGTSRVRDAILPHHRSTGWGKRSRIGAGIAAR